MTRIAGNRGQTAAS